MTLEEVFYDFDSRYQDDFCWRLLPLTGGGPFVEELKREMGKDHPLFDKRLWAVAKCDRDDRVLYLSDDGGYHLFHLTWSAHSQDGFPRCRRFCGIKELAEALEQEACGRIPAV